MPIDREHFFPAAFASFGEELRALIGRYPGARILELGGGRSPTFALDGVIGEVGTYTVNDISAHELSLLSAGYDAACFDVTSDVSAFAGRYDVVFSRTLAEHVSDGRAMHRNVLTLLRPGGVAFHMMPTLYSSPFVLNRLLPETLSRRILHAVSPRRRTSEPKFPAHYSWCYGKRERMTRMLSELGFRGIAIRSFYGHDYYRKFPGLQQLERALCSLAARRDWSSYASYAHVTAYK